MMSAAAAVIGGTSLTGGKGGIIGSIIGAFILRVIGDILIFSGVSSYWISLLQGFILILVVVIGSVTEMAKHKEANL